MEINYMALPGLGTHRTQFTKAEKFQAVKQVVLKLKPEITEKVFKGTGRRMELVKRRQLFCYLMQVLYPGIKLREIAAELSDRANHTQVIKNKQVIQNQLDTHYLSKEYIESLKFQVRNNLMNL